MLGAEYPSLDCSIARALEVVGERWTLLIIRELLRGSRRFSQLETALPLSKNILATRLEKLVAAGVAETVPVEGSRDWNRYRLTPKGLDLFPVVSALMAWGDTWEAPAGPPAVFEHECGGPAGHRLTCATCREPIDATTVQVTAGPGYLRRATGA